MQSQATSVFVNKFPDGDKVGYELPEGSDRESPQASYDKFIEEQELTHTYRLAQDEFNYLRQLFKFNAIPRYVLIDKDGTVLDDNYRMHYAQDKIKQLIKDKEEGL